MKVGIMQPYLFPYLGYYQLIKAVDTFVIYDDVNYIKQGWINRNRILLKGEAFMLTMSLRGCSSFKKINEIELVGNNHKLIKTIEQAYCKAPYFKDVFPLIANILLDKEPNLAIFLINSLQAIVNHLNISVPILISSEIEKDASLKGAEKCIDICKKLKSTKYINTVGGYKLYSKEMFAENGLILNFIKPNPIVYMQFKNKFVPCLTIIDVMMFNSPTEISMMLDNYELI